jgi:hypothetical protein
MIRHSASSHDDLINTAVFKLFIYIACLSNLLAINNTLLIAEQLSVLDPIICKPFLWPSCVTILTICYVVIADRQEQQDARTHTRQEERVDAH